MLQWKRSEQGRTKKYEPYQKGLLPLPTTQAPGCSLWNTSRWSQGRCDVLALPPASSDANPALDSPRGLPSPLAPRLLFYGIICGILCFYPTSHLLGVIGNASALTGSWISLRTLLTSSWSPLSKESPARSRIPSALLAQLRHHPWAAASPSVSVLLRRTPSPLPVTNDLGHVLTLLMASLLRSKWFPATPFGHRPHKSPF